LITLSSFPLSTLKRFGVRSKLDCKTVVFFANASDGDGLSSKGLERVRLARHSRITLTLLRAFRKRLFCMQSIHLHIFFGRPRQSSVFFGYLPKMFRNVRLALGQTLENLHKIFGKSPQTLRSVNILYHRNKITESLGDMKFIFSWWKISPIEQSKINFIEHTASTVLWLIFGGYRNEQFIWCR